MDAVAALYDTYGAELFQYCWLMLRSRPAAEAALRDAIMLAAAHVTRLNRPGSLRPWLFALARTECRRRGAAGAPCADEPVACPQHVDADRRLVAWRALMSLEQAERETLQLTVRHCLPLADVRLILGVTAYAATRYETAGRAHLHQAVAAAILVTRGGHECPGRAIAMRGWTGTLTPSCGNGSISTWSGARRAVRACRARSR